MVFKRELRIDLHSVPWVLLTHSDMTTGNTAAVSLEKCPWSQKQPVSWRWPIQETKYIVTRTVYSNIAWSTSNIAFFIYSVSLRKLLNLSVPLFIMIVTGIIKAFESFLKAKWTHVCKDLNAQHTMWGQVSYQGLLCTRWWSRMKMLSKDKNYNKEECNCKHML